MYEEKGKKPTERAKWERKIARILGVHLRTVQHHLKKMTNTLDFYKIIIQKLNKEIKFEYTIIDELYTYIGKKIKRYYVWACIGATRTNKKFYYYYPSKEKNTQALFLFNQDLPKVNKVYSDGNFSYDRVYGDKATLEESTKTNIIEDLNPNLEIKFLTS